MAEGGKEKRKHDRETRVKKKKKAKKDQELAEVPVGEDEENAAGKREKKKQKKEKKRVVTEVEDDEKQQAGAGQDVEENVAEAQKKMKKQKKRKREATGASASGEAEKGPTLKDLDNDINKLLLDSAFEGLEEEEVRNRGRYLRANRDTILTAWELHKDIIQPFEGLTAQEALDRLSDPSVSMTLRLPSFRPSWYSPTRTFTYVGRPIFPLLLHAMKNGQRINFGGHSGRGKSYLMAAMACYLHTYKDECGVVVYILMSKLIGDFDYLLEALFLAYAGDRQKQVGILALSTSKRKLFQFCSDNELLFLMDEVNQLDTDKKMAGSTSEERGAARSWRENFYTRGVSCASDDSTFQTMGDQDADTFLLNRPFDIDELSGWISATTENDEERDFQELTYYTGLIPRYLASYVRNKHCFIDRMQRQMRKFMENMEEKEEAAVRKVLNGELDTLDGLELDRCLFYERPFGEGTCVTVLPFLQTALRAKMDTRRDEGALKQQRDQFQDRILMLRGLMLDHSAKGLQPIASLNGWLAEGVTRDCMLLHKRCLHWEFQSEADYDDNCRVWKLDSLSADKLKQGVLFYPKQGTAKYADLHYVKLLEDGKTLVVRPVRISVSSWKRNKVKDSHTGWKENAKEHWSRLGCTTKWKFTYILSNALKQNLERKGSKVTVRTFKHVHPCLAFLDDLRDPELELQRGKGRNKCGNVKFQVGD